MRTIGFIIIAILFVPLFITREKIAFNSQQEKQLIFQLPFLAPSFQAAATKKSSGIDTNQLKQSNWYTNAMKGIEECEYEIKYDEISKTYASPNRQNNLRSFYSSQIFTLLPRNEKEWKLELTTLGVYAGKKLIYAPDENSTVIQIEKNIRFNHNNNFITEYINSKEGIRQNFIIEKEPSSKPQTLNIKLQTNKGWFVNKVHDKEIHFAKETATGYDKKITYNDLKVWDATGRELKSFFTTEENSISINVNAKNAVYPVTIDPISTTANTSLESNQADAWMGRQVTAAGDVNGDGYGDVIAGASRYDNGQIDEGAAFVYYGSVTGISSTPAIILESNQAGANMGTGVGSAGDVNNDGYSDIIVGCHLYDNGQTDEGAAFIYYGAATGINATPSAIVESNQAGSTMGFFTGCAGDVNADGYSDIIVGCHLYDNGQTDEGAAFIYHGSASGINTVPAVILESNVSGAYFGREVAGAGDVNGDDYSDVIVGAWGYTNGQTAEGAAYIFHGSAAGIISTPALIIESNQVDAQYGISATSAGDVNGDGYSDVIVGAYFYDNGTSDEGAAFIYNGSASGVNPVPAVTLEINQFESRFGAAVACAGDVNGDGYSDVIVGAYFYDNGETDEGATFLYQGSATGINPVAVSTVEPNQNLAIYGIALASAGDVNGDGYSDIIVGAYVYDNGQTDEGGAFIYHGAPNGLSVAPLVINNITQDRAGFGLWVHSAGDVNADGYSDVIIAAPWYDDGTVDEGRVFVYYGSATGISATASLILDEGNQISAYYGYSCAGVGDVNGDGYGDVAVSSYQYNGFGRVFIYFGSAAGLPNTSSQVVNGTQAVECFGVSVSGAGDVNGDGYSDVIIGSFAYDDGANTNEGRASVFHGSSTGLNSVPDRIVSDANQALASFGYTVSSAGDINGDGYSDIIVGSYAYDNGPNTDAGGVFIYYGSLSGIPATANLMLTGANQSSSYFGFSASGAGDINGDGFCDIVVGSFGYNGLWGRAYVYYGSNTGLGVTATFLENSATGSANGDRLGYSVASAGDVNGDGYSDIAVGADQYGNPGSDAPQGRVFIYHGKPSGVAVTPDVIITDNVNNRKFFGHSVASAGDVNGDGFSDIVVGGDRGSWAGFGMGWIFYGNDKGGLRNNLRLYNSDLITPMNRLNINDPNLFGAGLHSKSFIGGQKGKLVWQTIRNGNPFSGVPITNSTAFTAQQPTFTNLGLTGVELKNLVAKMVPTRQTYIRARVKYDLVTAITGQVYGPWRYPEGFLRGKREIADVALPVRFSSFTATKQNQNVLLKWITTNEEPGLKYEVQHSTDGINFISIRTTSAQLQLRNEYQYLHTKLAAGNNYYRIKAYLQTKESYSGIRQVYFSSGENKFTLYPNPVGNDQTFSIIIPSNASRNIYVRVINYSGQLVFKQTYSASGKIEIQCRNWPAGNYTAEVWSGESLAQKLKLVVLNN